MKKLFILALFVLGMCNAPVFGMEQEIVLTELYSIMPLDDPDDDGAGEGPDPTRIRATIDGTRMRVNARTGGAPVYVEVINQSTGEAVVEEEFIDETETILPQAGAYIVQIYSGNTIMTGEFEVE
ncbi:MAG: hypothetical protein II267_04985 [Paludibacteraceae bacterium]|nr:hypothetical protein [Paludibacteraceae bacterium]